MDKQNLEMSIQIVIDKELFELKSGVRTWELKTENGKQGIVYPHSDTLIDIFSNIQDKKELKDMFVYILNRDVMISNEIY